MGSPITSPATTDGWRPPQWQSGNSGPALTMVVTNPNTGEKTIYVFDTSLRADHEGQSVITLNPTQSGAPIADHAYIMPRRLTVELLMSDAMQSYFIQPPPGTLQSILSNPGSSGFSAGYWAGPSKSVSAYQTLLQVRSQRWPVSIATRLTTYDLMIISEVRAVESQETRYGGKFTVTFTEIFTATVTAKLTDSTRKQVTIITIGGTVNLQPVPDNIRTVLGSYPTIGGVSTAFQSARPRSVPGAGN